MERSQYVSLEAKQVMNRVHNMPFRWSFNPYRGCSHGCSFCYARGTHTFLGLTADDAFRTQVMVKSNAADALERQLEQMSRRHHWNLEALSEEIGSVAIGTATDPYQSIEAKTNVTRACLEVFARYRVPVTITTRSPLILRDMDTLKQMNLQSINLSINTLNSQIWRGLEPSSPAPAKRLDALAELRKNNLPVGVFLAPIIPILTDATADINRLLAAAQRRDALFIMPSLLRLADDMKPWFFAWIHEHYPEAEASLRHLYKRQFPPRAYAELKLSRIRLLMSRMGLSEYHQRINTPEPTVTSSALQPTREQLVLPL